MLDQCVIKVLSMSSGTESTRYTPTNSVECYPVQLCSRKVRIVLTRREDDNMRLHTILTQMYRIPPECIVALPLCSVTEVDSQSVELLKAVINRRFKCVSFEDGFDQKEGSCSLKNLSSVSLGELDDCDSIFVLSPEAGRIINSVLKTIFLDLTDQSNCGILTSTFYVLKVLCLGAVGHETALRIINDLPPAVRLSQSLHNRLVEVDRSNTTSRQDLLDAVFVPSIATKSNLISTYPWSARNYPQATTLLLGPLTSTAPSTFSLRKFHVLHLYDFSFRPPSQFDRAIFNSKDIEYDIIVFGSPQAAGNWITTVALSEESNSLSSQRIAVCMGPTTATSLVKCSIHSRSAMGDSTELGSNCLSDDNFTPFEFILYPQEPNLANLASTVYCAWNQALHTFDGTLNLL